MGVTDNTFQLARSIFSFHVEMIFFLGEQKASQVNKKIETWILKWLESIERLNQSSQGWNMAFLVKQNTLFLKGQAENASPFFSKSDSNILREINYF